MHYPKWTLLLSVFCWSLISSLPFAVHAAPLTKLLASLPDSNGKSAKVRLRDDYQLQVIFFLGCECPLAKLYGPRLTTLSEEFQNRGVSFIGINCNPQDSLVDVAAYVSKFAIPFPVLKDHDQVALKALDARRTPEVVVLDAKGFEVYRGRIDDQYEPGISRQQPSREDLRAAIEEYLAGTPVTTQRTEAVGCLIARRREQNSSSAVTYCNQVVRLLNQHCVECHRPGEIGPFSLTEYDEVIGWADMMQETIEQHRMPPWNANPEYGDFINARQFPETDREIIRQWIDNGVPFGNASDLPGSDAPAKPMPAESHYDLEIPMQAEPYEVAAEGTIEYQYFVVDPKFEEDRWVHFAQITPSNRSVVHHGIVFIRPPDGVAVNGIGWLTAYVPGQVRLEPPAYRARRIPAGSKLVFQMHYTPNGRPEKDLSVLRLTFADPKVLTEEHISLVSLNQELEIPAGAADVPVHGRSPWLPPDGLLLAMSPHMHLRGKSIRVDSKSQDVSSILLDVPKYDFNWQHTYVLRNPVPLNSLSELTFSATYDNSDKNPFNPDPTAFVTWGDQTWEEMAIVFYEVAIPITRRNGGDSVRPVSRYQPSAPQGKSETEEELVAKLFEDLDRDRDGQIEYEEVDQAVQLRSFRDYDLNRDRQIDHKEATEAARRQKR